jgi:Na+/H+ antiporter NhaD/arsenite permease-like protein
MGTAQIVFFLMGAMTIVEVIDAHHGFEVITSRIKTTQLSGLIWLIGIVTFLLSAILDNLTATIVMVSMLRKLISHREDRLLFAGIVVIAANAGGAWSPIGDVTTTMLWIGERLTAAAVMQALLLPSLVSMLVPLAITALMLRGKKLKMPEPEKADVALRPRAVERNVMFFSGLAILVAVPAFKTATHLPPFLGILLGLGRCGWSVTCCIETSRSRSESA